MKRRFTPQCQLCFKGRDPLLILRHLLFLCLQYHFFLSILSLRFTQLRLFIPKADDHKHAFYSQSYLDSWLCLKSAIKSTISVILSNAIWLNEGILWISSVKTAGCSLPLLSSFTFLHNQSRNERERAYEGREHRNIRWQYRFSSHFPWDVQSCFDNMFPAFFYPFDKSLLPILFSSFPHELGISPLSWDRLLIINTPITSLIFSWDSSPSSSSFHSSLIGESAHEDSAIDIGLGICRSNGSMRSSDGNCAPLLRLIGDPRGLLDCLGVGVPGISEINREALTRDGEGISGDRVLITVELICEDPVICRRGPVVCRGDPVICRICRGGSAICRGGPVVCRAANSAVVSLTQWR